MKEIRIGFVSILCIALLLPLINFNLEENYASPIDNRMLTEWNLSGGDITDMVESYINDRIGFRTEAIDAYTVPWSVCNITGALVPLSNDITSFNPSIYCSLAPRLSATL